MQTADHQQPRRAADKPTLRVVPEIRQVTPPEDWHASKPMAWCRALQPVRMPAGYKAVAWALAQYADRDGGGNARPGLSRLQWAAGVSRTTVIRALETLESMYLIHCTERNVTGGRGKASVWQLTLHAELKRYSEPFEAWQAARRPDDATRKGSPSGPFSAVKGPGLTPKGSRNDAQRVPVGTAPGTTWEEHQRRPTDGRRNDAADFADPWAADTAIPTREPEDDDLRWAREPASPIAAGVDWPTGDGLAEALDADAYEEQTINGMIANGSNPRAAANKVLADRRRP